MDPYNHFDEVLKNKGSIINIYHLLKRNIHMHFL